MSMYRTGGKSKLKKDGKQRFESRNRERGVDVNQMKLRDANKTTFDLPGDKDLRSIAGRLRTPFGKGRPNRKVPLTKDW